MKPYKLRIFLVTVALFAALCVDAQPINKGENVYDAYRKIEHPYFFKMPPATGWAEGADMLFIGRNANPNTDDFLFLALKDTTIIGVYKKTDPLEFLLVGKHDSILDNSSQYFFLPLWVVDLHSKIAPNDSAVLHLLNKAYQSVLQADDGRLDDATVSAFQHYKTDTTLANRQIILLYDNYQLIVSTSAADGKRPQADICIPMMHQLSGECLRVYNMIPAGVCVSMCEALMSAGMLQKAKEHVKLCLQFYPDSIPLQVFKYQLEDNETLKGKYLAELKRKHPNHWMVKTL